MKDPEPAGFVYLIGEADSPVVKIGKALNVAARLAEIQRMSPVKLVDRWAHPGDRRLERALHVHFAHRRTHGEWFDFEHEDPVTSVTAVVAELLDPKEPQTPDVPWVFVVYHRMEYRVPLDELKPEFRAIFANRTPDKTGKLGDLLTEAFCY